jgi:hypothetical protein
VKYLTIYFFIQEAHIPIDMVAGTGIGAFMGALFCADSDINTITQKAQEWLQVCSFYCYFCVMYYSFI